MSASASFTPLTTYSRQPSSLFSQGVRNGGGIADTIVPQSYRDDAYQRTRYLLFLVYIDLFFALITIIFNNLIAGIIIDSFSEQREEQQDLEAD